jgi:hypothetical protein
MNILYVNAGIYDFLTATIIEGLNELAAEGKVRLFVTARSNYARRDQVLSRGDVYRMRNDFDWYILGSSAGVDHELYWDVVRPGKAACIDGSDSEEYQYDPDRFNIYFKRELLAAGRDNVKPCPFAIERRWLQPLSASPKYFVSACFGPRAGDRAAVLDKLRTLSVPNSYVGVVRNGWTTGLKGVLKGQCTIRAYRIHWFGVGHNARYYRILRSSLMSLSVKGAGYDTARWWEILGAGALLLSSRNLLLMPRPFVPGEHYLEYSSPEELEEKLAWARATPGAVERIRLQARRHCQSHHTSKERARYVYETLAQ